MNLVPTLRVGMLSSTLCVLHLGFSGPLLATQSVADCILTLRVGTRFFVFFLCASRSKPIPRLLFRLVPAPLDR
jgi:hypothetical protein